MNKYINNNPKQLYLEGGRNAGLIREQGALNIGTTNDFFLTTLYLLKRDAALSDMVTDRNNILTLALSVVLHGNIRDL
jgi:hypothetical protein